MLVSIIIPIYNNCTVLERCVNSVIRQKYKEIEVILVDDGSTDSSGAVCDEFRQIDSRIKVIHQKNKGVVNARKNGLNKAQGEYILFVDADDWIQSEMLEELVGLASDMDADIVTSSWIVHRNNCVVQEKDEVLPGLYESITERLELAQRVFFRADKSQSMNDSLNTKLFRRKLIDKYLSEFPDGVAFTEDTFVAFTCIMNAECIYVSDRCYYHYMTTDSTANNSKNKYLLKDLNEGYIYAKKNAPKNELCDIYNVQLERILLSFLFLGMNKFMDIKDRHSFIRYYFPEGIIPVHSRIAIYGAGIVGQSYYKQLKKSYNVVYWTDKNKFNETYSEKKIIRPQEVNIKDVDYVLLAIKNKEMAQGVKKELIKGLNWSEKKIIWEKPLSILDIVIEDF